MVVNFSCHLLSVDYIPYLGKSETLKIMNVAANFRHCDVKKVKCEAVINSKMPKSGRL